MPSKKCQVCGCKSSSRWHKIQQEIQEDVKKCFNVETEETSSVEAFLCASCQRNFTRWKQNVVHKHKYLLKANSRGKPFVRKTNLAQQSRRFVKVTESSPDVSFCCLPEVILLDICKFLDVAAICKLRLTCSYLNKLCASNYLWKFSINRDFPDAEHLLDSTSLSKYFFAAYKLLHSVSLSAKREEDRHRTQMTEVEDQFREEERKLVEQNANLRQRLDSVRAKLTTLQLDRDPSTLVTQLQEQVNQ